MAHCAFLEPTDDTFPCSSEERMAAALERNGHSKSLRSRRSCEMPRVRRAQRSPLHFRHHFRHHRRGRSAGGLKAWPSE